MSRELKDHESGFSICSIAFGSLRMYKGSGGTYLQPEANFASAAFYPPRTSLQRTLTWVLTR